MHIIYRNFVRLLAAGSFNSHGPVESMSLFKWQRLMEVARFHGVHEYVMQGIIRSQEQGYNGTPSTIIQLAKDEAEKSDHFAQPLLQGDNYHPARNDERRFSNFIYQHRYNKIVYNEIHSIDTSTTTLEFLDICISHVNKMYLEGLQLNDIITFGAWLRQLGDKTDFVKIDQWIGSLHIGKSLDLLGSHLVALFGFDKEEIPFMKRYDEQVYLTTFEAMKEELMDGCEHLAAEKGRKTVSRVCHSNALPLKYFKYNPTEAASKVMANIARSLSNIDE